MTEQVYEIIDDIDSSKLKERLDNLKEQIRNDQEAKILIKRFEEAKSRYEKYNLKEDFLNAKKGLLNNSLLKEYIDIQNKINILILQINNRVERIKKGITNEK